MKDCFEMSPPCLTGGFPPLPPVREYHTMNYMGLPYNWQYHHQMYQSRTVPTSERRDSGVHSIADSNGSSPSSDDSEIPVSSSPYTHYCPPPRHLDDGSSTQNTSYPNSPPISVKEEPVFDQEISNHTPPGSGENNALQNLQQSVERNLNLSTPVKKENVCDNNNDVYNQEDYSVPSLNSHGKIKTIKCKQCQVVFNTKIEFWTHQRQHIKPDRLLQCEKCPFVTEYKHHLEYHLRNHGGEKPFRCKECDYKCVNKSMLNSHMKSHSSVYQYRCSDCNYTTKYCHSLKLHLRKYNHKPAMVLNPDGTPNPLPIIDVYGTRRGPKARSTSGEEEPEINSPKRIKLDVASPLNQMPTPMLPGVPAINPLFMAADPEMQMKLMFHQALFMHMMNQQNQSLLNNNNQTSTPTVSPKSEEESVLDLSREKSSDENEDSKGHLQSTSEDEEEEERMNLLYKVKVEHALSDAAEGPGGPTPPIENTPSSTPTDALRCPHCCITFDDIALFTIHMRFHNFSDPFTCNSCGEKCDNKIEFTVHIFSKPH